MMTAFGAGFTWGAMYLIWAFDSPEEKKSKKGKEDKKKEDKKKEDKKKEEKKKDK